MIRARRPVRTVRSTVCIALGVAATMLAGCTTFVTPGPFQITVRDTDDTVLEKFEFQAGSSDSLDIAIVGMCRVYPEAIITAEQLKTHERVKEKCRRSFASMLTSS